MKFIQTKAKSGKMKSLYFLINNYKIGININNILSVTLIIFIITKVNFSQTENWEQIGSGSYFDLKVINDSSIYACSLDRGLEFSSDGGISWIQKNPSSAKYSIGAIAINDSTNTIFISSLLDHKIYKSTNIGDGWSASLNEKGKIYKIISNDGIVYAIDSLGTFYNSSDNGSTWDSSQVCGYPLSSIGVSTNGQIFVGTHGNKIYVSNNSGKTWNKIDISEIDNDVFDIAINKGDEIFAISEYRISSSTDLGTTWKYSDLPPSLAGIKVLFIDDDSNWYSGITKLFKSANKGKDWINFGGTFTNIKKINVYRNNIYVAASNGIFRYDQSSTIYTGTNYFPLHKGNKWLFKYISSDYNTNNPEQLQQISIDRDTIINDNKYYLYRGRWIRYSEKQKKVYIWYNDSEGIYMDFNLPGGSLYERTPPFFEPAAILEGSQNLFSVTVKFKGYSAGSIWSDGETREEFGENIGPILYTYTRYAGPDETNEADLLMALIYDSTNTSIYYSNHYKPEIHIEPLFTISTTPFQLIFTVTHYYGEAVTGPVYMDSYYSNGDTAIINDSVLASLIPGTNSSLISFPVDTLLLKDGFIFSYRIIAKDKGLIPEYSYSPDSGYYQCKWEPYTSVEDRKGKQLNFKLEQNYPNPFNPSTTISYTIPKREYVTLKVYDILGREIAALVNEEKPAGSYKIVFNIQQTTNYIQLPSGIYFYRIHTGEFTRTMKFILMK